jgi:hypothetical protein
VGENLQDHLQIRPVYKVTGVPTLNLTYANLIKRGWMVATAPAESTTSPVARAR